MDVSIIFVNYKTKDLTINAINSVIEKTEGIEYEIFVVDNASGDGSIEAIEQQFPNINIIKSDINGGFGYANNLAIKQAKGKYILCLNTDTLLVNNAIKIMFDYMEKAETQGVAVCGCNLSNNNKPVVCGGNLPTLVNVFWKFGLRNALKTQYKKYNIVLTSSEVNGLNMGYITGADFFVRKTVLNKVGLFDESFFMYYEETDLCKRIKEAGYYIHFVESAKIQHLENQSIDSALNHLKMVKKSEMIYFRKHHPNQVWMIKLAYCLLYLIDWLVLKNKNSKELIRVVING